jgi:Spy/CpxP family protein refolding chaperone
MYKLKTLALALLLTSLVIAPAFAKRHGGSGPCDHDGKGTGQIEQLKLVLDLTPQQETEIKGVFAESREKMAPLREKKHANKEAIHNIVDADVLDEPRLRELVREQTELHADMMIARHATRSRVNQILTPEQQEKRKALRQQRMEHKGSRRCAEPAACNSK